MASLLIKYLSRFSKEQAEGLEGGLQRDGEPEKGPGEVQSDGSRLCQ